EVRAGDSNHLRLVLALVRLPKEGVRILDAPPAGRLPGLDVEVQVGPPTAAAFLAENADLLPRLDARAGLDGVGDRFQVRVAVVPAVGVENVDVVVIAARLVERGF